MKREYLIGHSYDIHRFDDKGDFILLAYVKIPTENLSVIAHSDGDCLLHSLSEAILSALGLNDIGYYFPDNSEDTSNMDSREILTFALSEMRERNYEINNVVIHIALEKPKLSKYKLEIKKSLAELLNCEEEYISVLAGTEENIGAIGQSLAVKVTSTVMLRKETKNGN